MAEIWKPQSIEVYEDWIDKIRDTDDELNDWESGFIDSLANRLVRKINLTELQAEKLEQIYVKYTS